MRNAFSPEWYELFAEIPAEHTRTEVEFVRRNMPLPDFPRILDVACGYGRHSRPLSMAGYSVLGVDRSPEAIEKATASCERAEFRLLDMRQLSELAGPFDGALSMWHSFGYFDDATNQAVLQQLHDLLRPRGRLLLDVYNRAHAVTGPEFQRESRSDTVVETKRSWSGSRLHVDLTYDGRSGDQFDWHLYSEEELVSACRHSGFSLILSCAWFDESVPPGPEHGRMQLLLERSRQ
jgi:SAM-dependent methyltransferase